MQGSGTRSRPSVNRLPPTNFRFQGRKLSNLLERSQQEGAPQLGVPRKSGALCWRRLLRYSHPAKSNHPLRLLDLGGPGWDAASGASSRPQGTPAVPVFRPQRPMNWLGAPITKASFLLGQNPPYCLSADGPRSRPAGFRLPASPPLPPRQDAFHRCLKDFLRKRGPACQHPAGDNGVSLRFRTCVFIHLKQLAVWWLRPFGIVI